MESSVILPNEHQEVDLKELKFEGYGFTPPNPKKENQKMTIRVIIIDVTGKKHKSFHKKSDGEICSLLIGQALLSD